MAELNDNGELLAIVVGAAPSPGDGGIVRLFDFRNNPPTQIGEFNTGQTIPITHIAFRPDSAESAAHRRLH